MQVSNLYIFLAILDAGQEAGNLTIMGHALFFLGGEEGNLLVRCAGCWIRQEE